MSKIRTVKVLALTSSWQRPEYLDAVLDVLRCFPCLEKLYVIVSSHLIACLLQMFIKLGI